MGDKSKIEWTDSTWNPIRGCTKVSAGCDNCYAMGVAHRFSGPGQPYEGLTRVIGGRGQWNGEVRMVPDLLTQPMRWRKPRRIFVNSMSDLFHEKVHVAFLDAAFAVMALSPQHQFQILTKRPERMRDYLSDPDLMMRVGYAAAARLESGMAARKREPEFPFPNIWLGVSVEDQATADARIPILLETPASVRWISAEPLLGPIDLAASRAIERDSVGDPTPGTGESFTRGLLDWVVVGGESGPNARPMHPDWARSIRDQCVAAGVPFLFKQWGEWAPVSALEGMVDEPRLIEIHREMRGGISERVHYFDHEVWVVRLGKKIAGRVLDGRTWDEYPA